MLFKKNRKKKDTIIKNMDDIKDSILQKDDLRERLSPNINTVPLGYTIINDVGIDLYTRSFYIEKMPNNVSFVTTFLDLLKYDRITSSVFVEPIEQSKAIHYLKNSINEIDSEAILATKGDNRNEQRRINKKLRKTESWVDNIEDGANTMYHVSFLFTISAKTLEELDIKSLNLISKAREKTIELVSCYGSEPEAFLTNGPYNKEYKSVDNRLISTQVLKKHTFDKNAMLSLYTHTYCHFSHKRGVPLGRNLRTKELVLYDVFDPSHDGYGVVITGMTGSGKSAMIKIMSSRMILTDTRFGIIDSDRKGSHGEYYLFTKRHNGLYFQISANSSNIMNIYEIDEHEEYDELLDTEYRTLKVLDTIATVVNHYKTMIKGNLENMEYKDDVYITRIITDIITEQYAEKGIIDGEPDSLFEEGTVLKDGKITSGRVKKKLPTISECYIKTLKRQKEDTALHHKEAYTIILDTIKDRVRELCYNKKTFEVYTKEQYEEFKRSNSDIHKEIEYLKGIKGYFDGQSNIDIMNDRKVIDIDISDIPKQDIPIAQLIALNYMNEHYVKRNSENPKNAKKLVLIIEEVHKMFPYYDAVKILEDFYRTLRKRNVSPWLCTQAFADFVGRTETEAMLMNATSKFLFKQNSIHRELLLKNTILTESEVDGVISLGGSVDYSSGGAEVSRKGEVCLIDNNRVVFLKVDYLVDTECEIVETDINKVKSRLNAG